MSYTCLLMVLCKCACANLVSKANFIIIIIIITLFQEDNIFGRVASLTYGPQLTNVGHDIIKMNRHACTIIYSMYRVNALRTPSRL